MATELTFGGWLQRRRRGLGFTQDELGQRIGYSGETIRKVEADTVRPSRQMAEKLALSLDIPAAERDLFIRFARDEDPAGLALPGPASRPSVPGARLSPVVLPTPPTPLVGREAERAAASEYLRHPAVRLVTFSGAGGVGKTRLALQVARDVAPVFRDGVYFVDLAPITDPALVLAAIARGLGVKESADQPLLASVQRALAGKHLLLVLDNFEQVTAAAPLVAELLAAAPELKALVTSRTLLRLRGERELVVPPLSLPAVPAHPPAASDLAAIADAEAVQLFVARVRDAQPGFALTPANAAAVVQVCARLDGLPLAIELAAARARVLTPEAMLPRLQRRLAFLTGGAADLPARQQTLQATLDWSYSLLTPSEQALFTRLAVFHGGFTLEAAEAVCGEDEAEGRRQKAESGQEASLPPTAFRLLPSDILNGVESLVAKSLVRRVLPTDGGADVPSLPLTMLETVREYALARFEASAEAASVREQHAAYYLLLVEEAEPQLMGAEVKVWLGRLGAEWDNIRAAVGWLRAGGQAEARLRLVSALRRCCELQGRSSEALAWLEEGLDQESAVAPAVRAKALHAASNLAQNVGDLDKAVRLGEASLALRRELGDRQGMARTLNNLAVTVWSQGDFNRARELHAASLALKRALNDRLGMAYSLNNLGLIATDQDDYPTARALLAESLALRRELGDLHGVAVSLLNLGNVARQQGQLAEARALYEESLAQVRVLGDRASEARVQSVLGLTLAEQGDYRAAFPHLQASLDLRRSLGNQRDVTVSLNNLGQAALYQGDAGWARLLFEDALALAREGGAKMGQAHALGGLGQAALAEGRWEDARRYLTEGLAVQRELGDQGAVATTRLGLARLDAQAGERGAALAQARDSLAELHRLGIQRYLPDALETLVGLLRPDPVRAARLSGAAAARRERLGLPRPQGEREAWARCLAEVRGRLGEDAFEALYQAGRALPLDQAVTEALAA